MLFDPSSTIIALRNQRRGFDQVRLDGPVAEQRSGRPNRFRSTSVPRRRRFGVLRAAT